MIGVVGQIPCAQDVVMNGEVRRGIGFAKGLPKWLFWETFTPFLRNNYDENIGTFRGWHG